MAEGSQGTAPLAIVVMGPSGVGKTTTAEGLAARLGWPCAEADRFHPQANIDKMSAGTPLTDEDRWPWLRLIRDWIDEEARAGRSVVLTCSALKRSYRDVLREAGARVRFLQLSGDPELVGQRIGARKGHYMPPSLLASQFAALEPLHPDEDGATVAVSDPPDIVVEKALDALGLSPRARA